MWATCQSAKFWVTLGAILAGMAVVLGAYGSHMLEGSEEVYDKFLLSVQYHMWHALALLAVGWQCSVGSKPNSWAAFSGIFFATGIFLFSGNLYVFAITGNPAIIGATPVGGFCFICGWTFLALASFLQKRGDS